MKKVFLILTALFISCTAMAQWNFFHTHRALKPSVLVQNKNTIYPDSIERSNYNIITGSYEQSPSSTQYPQYDGQGNLISEETVNHAGGGNNTKVVYTYAAFGADTRLKSRSQFTWDNLSSTWLGTNKTSYLWDRFGNDSAIQNYSYDTGNQNWKLGSVDITSYMYDLQNRTSQITYAEYNAGTQTYSYQERVHFYYQGTDSVPSLLVIEDYDGSKFVESYKADNLKWGMGYTGNLDSNLPTYWMTYMKNGTVWDTAGLDSVTMLGGKDYQQFSYAYDTVSHQFDLTYTSKLLYDAVGNQIYSEDVDWFNGVADTGYVSIDLYQYGTSNEVLTHESIDYSYSSGNKIRSGYKDVYYYDHTGLTTISNNLAVYPNPCRSSSIVNLPEGKWKNMEMFSIDGKKVDTGFSQGSTSVNLPSLKDGIYLIQVEDENGNRFQAKIQVTSGMN
ncbi:MAG: T9SS type A sorting domain-containing protein [Bacteroidetes bacterium]|nr:T9SS type A sorting domain-containing protein [Bacteroidota bacterium]